MTFSIFLAVVITLFAGTCLYCILASRVIARALDRHCFGLELPVPGEDVIVLYDGECGLCDRGVQFVLKEDRTKAIRFAPLQSDKGRELAGNAKADLSSVIVWIDGRLFRCSDATAILLRQVGLPWSLLGTMFSLLPRGLRDAAYNYVAAHRHAWFPFQSTSCRMGTPEERARFWG